MYACVYNKNFESICLVYLKQREMLRYVQFRSAYVRIILYVVRACAIKISSRNTKWRLSSNSEVADKIHQHPKPTNHYMVSEIFRVKIRRSQNGSGWNSSSSNELGSNKSTRSVEKNSDNMSSSYLRDPSQRSLKNRRYGTVSTTVGRG